MREALYAGMTTLKRALVASLGAAFSAERLIKASFRFGASTTRRKAGFDHRGSSGAERPEVDSDERADLWTGARIPRVGRPGVDSSPNMPQ